MSTFVPCTAATCSLPTCENTCLLVPLNKSRDKVTPNYQCSECKAPLCTECSMGCVVGVWDDGVYIPGTSIQPISPEHEGAVTISFGIRCPMCNKEKMDNVYPQSMVEWMVANKTQGAFVKEAENHLGCGDPIAVHLMGCDDPKCNDGIWYRCPSIKLAAFPTALFFGRPMAHNINLPEAITNTCKTYFLRTAERMSPGINMRTAARAAAARAAEEKEEEEEEETTDGEGAGAPSPIMVTELASQGTSRTQKRNAKKRAKRKAAKYGKKL